jgi:ankyrin repeat protein
MVTWIIRRPISPLLHVYKLRLRTSQDRQKNTIYIINTTTSTSLQFTSHLLLGSSTSAMALLDLQNELLRDISEYLECERYINAVAQANRRLYRLLDSYLYRYNVQQSGSSALLWAAQHGQEATAQKSLREKANIQATDDDDNEAPLLLAAENGHKQVVKLLVDKGAEVNAQGGGYGNALQTASARGYKEIVKLLLDKGAEVDAQGGYYGDTLQAASAGGHEVVVRLLVDKGAEVNAQGGPYGNALQAASARGYKEIVKLLLNKGANVNAQGGLYNHALYAALDGGYGEIVKLLLDKGAVT